MFVAPANTILHPSATCRSGSAQLRLPILIVVPRNNEYSILKSFARLEETPGVPGLEIPGFDIVSIAKG